MRTLFFNALALLKHSRSNAVPIDEAFTSWAVRLGIALLVFGVGCRVFLSWLNLPLFADEACLAINCFDRDYQGLTYELSYMQVAPVLFLWIEKTVCTLVGPSPWFLRLVPLMAGIGGLLLFWPVLRRCVSPAAACVGIGIMAVLRDANRTVEHVEALRPRPVLLRVVDLARVENKDGDRRQAVESCVADPVPP